MKNLALSSLAALVVLSCAAGLAAPRRPGVRPNILVILADDMGYGDIGVHGCKDIPTPYIDSIAKQGVRCSQGYVSAPQCAPTRCGLLLGRYQQRFGCDTNPDLDRGGLPLSQPTLAARLKEAGYITGMVGKWHLGREPQHHPNARGFDEFFGFLGGANPYLPRPQTGVVPNILRNRQPVPEREYLTDAFAREAAAFVERHKGEPFFLYLAPNAPHGPAEASEKYLARFERIADPRRRIYAAQVSAMDDMVGAVLGKLREHGLEERTLVFFLSDNGGPLGRAWNGSSNAPLRGQKGDTLEGGLRVPFLVRWKGVLPAGKLYDRPVSALDILPTALRAAGVDARAKESLDGVDILPHLTGKNTRPPHEVLYWRFSFPRNRPSIHKWAIRQGDWKLVREAEREEPSGNFTGEASIRLFDLRRDIGEATDLKAKEPARARALEARWKQWNAQMPPIRFGANERRGRDPAANPRRRERRERQRTDARAGGTDVTRELRCEGVRCRHAAVRVLVHGLYSAGRMPGYTRALRDMGGPVPAFLYYPMADAGTYSAGGDLTLTRDPLRIFSLRAPSALRRITARAQRDAGLASPSTFQICPERDAIVLRAA